MDAWKVAILGDGGVGKTCIAVQFTLNKFIEWYDPTIEDTYRTKLLVDNRMCFVEVIDTAGQEEYSILRDQWAREGQGFILVYSVAHRSSFNRIQIFKDAMLRAKRYKPIFILVGNKIDRDDREVSTSEGHTLARELGCEYMETSAKTAYNVREVFIAIIRGLRNESAGPTSPSGSGGGGGGSGGPGKRKKKKGGGCIIA